MHILLWKHCHYDQWTFKPYGVDKCDIPKCSNLVGKETLNIMHNIIATKNKQVIHV